MAGIARLTYLAMRSCQGNSCDEVAEMRGNLKTVVCLLGRRKQRNRTPFAGVSVREEFQFEIRKQIVAGRRVGPNYPIRDAFKFAYVRFRTTCWKLQIESHS